MGTKLAELLLVECNPNRALGNTQCVGDLVSTQENSDILGVLNAADRKELTNATPNFDVLNASVQTCQGCNQEVEMQTANNQSIPSDISAQDQWKSQTPNL